jgi:hypothetical protein
MTIETKFATQSRQLEFYPEGNGFAVIVDGKQKFLLFDGTVNQLLRKIKNLRSQKFFPQSPQKSVILQWPDGKIILRRDDGENGLWILFPSRENGTIRILGRKPPPLFAKISALEWKEVFREHPAKNDLEICDLMEEERMLEVDGHRVVFGRRRGGFVHCWDQNLRVIITADEKVVDRLFAVSQEEMTNQDQK